MHYLTLFFILSFTCAHSQSLTPLVDSIPMRDGKKLAADIYIPSGCTGCPVILIQTPYNRLSYRNSLPLGTGTDINSSDYIFVITDWRGFYGSADAAVSNPERGKDGYDAVQWIAAQSWSNGKVGTWGASALGLVQYETAKENPPALKCAVPVVSAPQFLYRDYFPGGVYRKEFVDQLDALGFNLSPTLLANPVYNSFWQAAEAATYYPEQINAPMLMIAGWFDHNTNTMVDFFNGLRQSSPIKDKHRLVIGPWAHGKPGVQEVGTVNQGALSFPEAAFDNDSLALAFFDHHLRDIPNGWDTSAFVHYFQVGEDKWERSANWPVPELASTTNLFFYQDGTMQYSYPQNESDFATITYDPLDPSPTIGGAALRQDLLQGPYDQAPQVESRNDILTFATAPLAINVQMKGYSAVHLNIMSDREDTDFAVRLTDVYPDGTSMLLSEGIQRARFVLNDYTTDTIKLKQGAVYHIDIDMPYLAHTFLAGHRLRIDLTSSNYPRYDKNLNNGGPMYTSGDTLVATNKILLDKILYSYLEIKLTGYPDAIDEKGPELFDFNIFPNPAHTKASLNFDVRQSEHLKIEAVDLMGRTAAVIADKHFDAGAYQVTFPVDNLGSGLYFIRIQNGSGTQAVKKLVIKKH